MTVTVVVMTVTGVGLVVMKAMGVVDMGEDTMTTMEVVAMGEVSAASCKLAKFRLGVVDFDVMYGCLRNSSPFCGFLTQHLHDVSP